MNSALGFAVLIGLAAGLFHVLTGPDHLGAIAPLAALRRRQSWVIGLRWGLGHSLGVVLVGLAAALIGRLVNVDPFSQGCERVVGVMLIAIGLWGFLRLAKPLVAASEHGAGLENAVQSLSAGAHDHAFQHALMPVHTHDLPSIQFAAAGAHRRSDYVPYAIGILHGCAGSSHLLGILPALALPTFAGVMGYLAGFVAGTLLAMAAFAAGIGALANARGISVKTHRMLIGAASTGSCAIGCCWLVI